MKIVILDGFTANPGDLSWDGLRQFGELTVHDRTAPDQIIERAKDAQIVLTNKVPLNAETLVKLPKLKYIGVLATGYNIVDVAEAARRGIVVTNVPGYSTDAVAQHVFAMILHLYNQLYRYNEDVQKGVWESCPDFSFGTYPVCELSGKTFGVVGYGQIGQRVAKIADAFGMQVLLHSRTKKESPYPFAEREELFQRADIISLHCPLTPQTEGMVNRDSIALMKQSAVIINTGRGPLICEQDLADALNSGRIAGAGVDVLSQEPPKDGNPLIGAKNCIITPHIAWAGYDARVRLIQTVTENIDCFLKGIPKNVVKG